MLISFLVFGACAVVAQEDPSVQELRDGNLKVTSELYKKFALHFKDRNFVIPPLCMQIMGDLIQSGAKGVTGEQIRTSHRLPSTKEQADKAAKIVFYSVTGDKSYILDMVGKTLIPQNQAVKSSYTFNDYYENIDFGQNNAAKIINSWIRNSSHNKVDTVVTSEQFNSQTSVYVAKGVVLQANWTNPFSPQDIARGDFYISPTCTVQADYIHQHGYIYNYRECEELDAYFLELPLADQSVVLTIVLPRTRNGITKLENRIDEVFKSHDYHKTALHLHIPKFSIESTIEAKDVFKTMGMTAAFNKNEADLSGLAGNKGDLFLSQMVFKTVAALNEGGFEVPPATNNTPPTTACGRVREFPADHPFIWYVKAKNFIILAGRLFRPN